MFDLFIDDDLYDDVRTLINNENYDEKNDDNNIICISWEDINIINNILIDNKDDLLSSFFSS